MSTKAKSILKYIIIFVVVATLVLLAVFLIFPKPKALDAYSYTLELNSNQKFKEQFEANQNLSQLCSSLKEDPELNLDAYYNLEKTYNVLKSLEKINNFNSNKLAYASNSKLYNSNCRAMKKLLKQMNEQLEDTSNYISSQLNLFLESSNPTAKTTNTYVFALYDLNNKLINNFYEFVDKSTQIVLELEQDVTLNPLSCKMLSILTVWNNLQKNSNLQAFDLFNNSKILLGFSNKLESQSKLFYKNLEFYNELLEDLNLLDLNTDLLKLGTNLEEEIKQDQEEDKLIKINNAIAFLKEA